MLFKNTEKRIQHLEAEVAVLRNIIEIVTSHLEKSDAIPYVDRRFGSVLPLDALAFQLKKQGMTEAAAHATAKSTEIGCGILPR